MNQKTKVVKPVVSPVVLAAKKSAQTLKTFFAERKIAIKLGLAQDAIARLAGVRDWNVFSAQATKAAVSAPEVLTWTHLDDTLGFFSNGVGFIEGVLVGESPRDTDRWFKNFHYVDVDQLLMLDREIQGTASAEDIEDLDALCNGDDDQIVLDWGDEYTSEGLFAGELRHAEYQGNGAWKLTDGRIMSFFRTQVIGAGSCPQPNTPWQREAEPPVVEPADTSKVRAQIHSDDRVFETHWNILPWLKSASKSELIGLARADWQTDEAADKIALAMEDSIPEIAELLTYCRKTSDRKNSIGFEVQVDYEDALAWLLKNRPDVYPDVLAASNLAYQDRF